MYVLGTESEANNFEVEYVLEGKGNRARFNSKVFSLAVHYEEVMSQNMLFTVPLTMAKALDGDSKFGYLEYAVNIRNLKQEAKDEDVESGISDAE